jgi:hypothetical protein
MQPVMQHTRIVLLGSAVLLLSSLAGAQQQPGDANPRKTELEAQKLELEIASLKRNAFPGWGIGALGLAVGIAGTASTLWVARRTRAGALDQSVHDSRLQTYPQLVKSTSPLGVYFPHYGSAIESLVPATCARMGWAMSQWYFNSGGLLLSEQSRDAYFKFARALTRAALAPDLAAPAFPADSERISLVSLAGYRAALGAYLDLDDPERWTFGKASSRGTALEDRFKDYVFLQRLSSRLRTALAEDLRSRRRPS